MEIVLKDSKNILTISEMIFGRIFNKSLIHQVVISYLSKKRQGSKAQKSRAEVSGSGKKPWRQKGTGRARVGSIRSPLWRSGGVTFAAKPKNYFQKVNKKMYKGALQSIFSELIRQERLLIFNKFDIDLPKTNLLINKLKKIKLDSVLIITECLNINLFYAARNLHKVSVLKVDALNPISLISFKNVITTVSSIKKIESILL